MSRAKELLADPEVCRFLQDSPSCRNQVRAAAEYLAEKTDGLRALKKALFALASGVINFYLSCANRDAQFTKFFVNTLRRYSAGKIRIYYEPELSLDLNGRALAESIRDKIANANWFILLLLDPSDDYDWHLFEAGQFTAQMTSADRMICLHHPDCRIPHPLKPYLGVSLLESEIERFLEAVFLQNYPIPGMPAINPMLDRAGITNIAEQIVREAPPLAKKPKSTFLSDQIFIKIPKRQDINEHELPMNVTIEATPFSTKLFNLQDITFNWQTLRLLALEQGNKEWVEQVSNAIYILNKGRMPSPITVLYKSGHSFYQTILIESRERGAEQLEVDILFVEKEKEDAIWTERHSIFGDAKKLSDPPDLFMLMPFDEKLSPVFYDHVKSVATEFQFHARRADDFFSLNSIVSDIWSAICQAEIIIGDCTGRNPNVFYEIGIAHTLNKSTILISQSIDDVPFDLRHLRCLVYDYTPRGMKEFETKLKNMLNAILAQKKIS